MMNNKAMYNLMANTKERPVSLQEIENHLDWLHRYIVEFDNFLFLKLNEKLYIDYKSIFVDKDLLFDRTFIGQTILRLNIFRQVVGKDLYITSQSMTYYIDNEHIDEELLLNFKKDFDTLDFNIILYAQTYYLGQLTGRIGFLLETIWGLIFEVEPIFIKSLELSKAKKIVQENLLKIEKSRIISPKSVYFRDHFREKEQSIYELLKKHFDTIDTNSEESSLVNVIIKSLKKVQGIGIHISSKEKARTKVTAEFIQNFIAKDESGYGFSETLKTIGEIDILIEKNDGNAVAICEGFNLKNILNKGVITSHINKLFTYDVNGLKANFIIVYAETPDLNVFWDKYYSFIQSINTPYNLIEIALLSDEWLDLPTDIKLCKLTYSRNGLKTVVYHVFVHMK